MLQSFCSHIKLRLQSRRKGIVTEGGKKRPERIKISGERFLIRPEEFLKRLERF